MASFDKVRKICYGPKVEHDEELKIFRERVLECLKLSAAKTFQISDDDGMEMTYEELKIRSLNVAMNLREIVGVGEGDVISVLLDNSMDVAPIIFGCILNGSIFNPLTHQQEFNEKWFGMHLTAVQPKLIIMEKFVENYQDMLKLVGELKINCKLLLMTHHEIDENFNIKILFKHHPHHDVQLFINNNIIQHHHHHHRSHSSEKINNESTIALIPSSGTTGIPKLIQLNGFYFHRMDQIWRFPDHVVGFSYSTISWLTGLAMLIFPLLHNGKRIITKAKFTPESFGMIVKKYKITHTFASAEMARMMLKMSNFNFENNFATIRNILCGGERLSRNVREFMRGIFRGDVFNMAYGATEVGVVTELDGGFDTSQFIDNVVGQPKANIWVKITDISNAHIVKDVGQCGEILIKNGNFSGYYNNDEMSGEAIAATDDGCWYKTSDVGYFDENGQLYVLGRKNQMLKIDNEQEMIHSSIIENIFESFHGISAACAVNLSNNAISVLCEVCEDNSSSSEDIKQLAIAVLKNLKFKFDLQVFIVHEIPRTNPNSRKIHRHAAQQMAEEKFLSASSSSLLDNETFP